MKVLLVDDHALFREGMVSLLRTQPDVQVVGDAGGVNEAIQMVDITAPDIVLIDFYLPDGTGLDATKAIMAHRPDTMVVFLTVEESDDHLLAAIRSGAKGYLLKSMPLAKVMESLRGLACKEAAISSAMVYRIMEVLSEEISFTGTQDSGISSLSLRELEVLREIAKESTNGEIAERLFITEITVKNCVHNILRKLNLTNRRQASEYARRQGLGSY